ncbi:hypothetical protein [Sulfuritalea sp.]|uniref:hypothetical protein n=1 Tax=Sulfuritalea sp. TaxID=2480090 RepID=UPI001AD41F71|nr:hypothetical protein [Sulfuritalea sp.]MBN8475523.1 hypothetical protein [Sulfuritalea sp.]
MHRVKQTTAGCRFERIAEKLAKKNATWEGCAESTPKEEGGGDVGQKQVAAEFFQCQFESDWTNFCTAIAAMQDFFVRCATPFPRQNSFKLNVFVFIEKHEYFYFFRIQPKIY